MRDTRPSERIPGKNNKQKTDITLNLRGIYKWGDFSPYHVADRTEELVDIVERIKENKEQQVRPPEAEDGKP